MRAQFLPTRLWLALVVAIGLIAALAFSTPAPAEAPQPPSVALPTVAPPTALPASRATSTAALPPPTPTTIPSATPVPPTPTPSAIPTPSPRPPGTVPRVGIQVGHWKSSELPEELERLRTSSGAFAAGLAEADVNMAVARRVLDLLVSRGIQADLLPATVPVSYDADAFVAIHADGSTSPDSRGFKLAAPWRSSRAALRLLDMLTEEYAAATGLPQDDGITFNMRGYYAFNYRRHQHAVARTTPAVILEMGFLTSAADRAVMVDQPDRAAVGIANGIVRYLNARDPNDGAALLPPEFRVQRSLSPAGVDVLAAPRDDARVLEHAAGDARLFVFQERDGWYQVVVRGSFRTVGWVRKDQVAATNDPPPTPPPASDS